MKYEIGLMCARGKKGEGGGRRRGGREEGREEEGREGGGEGGGEGGRRKGRGCVLCVCMSEYKNVHNVICYK